jgi:hypothetical protein
LSLASSRLPSAVTSRAAPVAGSTSQPWYTRAPWLTAPGKSPTAGIETSHPRAGAGQANADAGERVSAAIPDRPPEAQAHFRAPPGARSAGQNRRFRHRRSEKRTHGEQRQSHAETLQEPDQPLARPPDSGQKRRHRCGAEVDAPPRAGRSDGDHAPLFLAQRHGFLPSGGRPELAPAFGLRLWVKLHCRSTRASLPCWTGAVNREKCLELRWLKSRRERGDARWKG